MIRRVTLSDIPKSQERLVLSGSPIYRVFVRDSEGRRAVNQRRNDFVRSWALFGWMRDTPRKADR